MPTLNHDELISLASEYCFRTRIESRSGGPVFVGGRGSVVVDSDGREYLDFNSGQMCAALGHSHPRIVQAIKQAADTFIHGSSTFFNVPEINLVERLSQLVPRPLKRSLILGSGSDSNEAAMAIAKRYTNRYEIASPHISFHGLNDSARAVTFGLYHRGYGPFIPGVHALFAPYCYRCPLGYESKGDESCCQKTDFACLKASFEMLDAECDAPLAAVITEPLFSAGGVIEPPTGWLAELKRMCEARGTLLILDEAQTGLAKLGTMFAFEHEGTIPDIVTISKHFGGGLEVSAVITSDKIEQQVTRGEPMVFGHSHSSDPMPCAVALESLNLIVDEKLADRARDLGQYFHERLVGLKDRHELVGDVRGRGLLQGIELVRDRLTKEPANAEGLRIGALCSEAGLLFSVRGASGRTNVLRFVPPFTTTYAQIDQAIEILETAIITVVGEQVVVYQVAVQV